MRVDFHKFEVISFASCYWKCYFSAIVKSVFFVVFSDFVDNSCSKAYASAENDKNVNANYILRLRLYSTFIHYNQRVFFFFKKYNKRIFVVF